MLTIIWVVLYPYIVYKNRNRYSESEEWRNKFPSEDDYAMAAMFTLIADAVLIGLTMIILKCLISCPMLINPISLM